MSKVEELQSLGFARAGSFSSGQFSVEPEWKPHQVVYVWTRGNAIVLRVGIACGTSGFGKRYASYNRWLAGRHKPQDATEQEKARLFRSRLDQTCQVWARQVADKPTALKEEAELRTLFGPELELDLMTRGWAKQELASWRASRFAIKDAVPTPALARSPLMARAAHTVAPSLVAVFATLDSELLALGLEKSEVAHGWTYKVGRTLLCRIDPKNMKGCLRVWVGSADERAAPIRLRGQFKQDGWLVVWPEDQALACDYVRVSVRRRLPAQP